MRLGGLYENGEGDTADPKEALRWYRMVAARGNADAQVQIGSMYEIGQRLPQDNVRALMWYDIAVSSMDGAHGRYAPETRDKLAAKVASGERDQAEQLARRCLDSGYKDCGWP